MEIMNLFSSILTSPILAEAEAGNALSPNVLQMMIWVLLFGGMYFLLIAPNRKRQKEHAKMLSEISSGDSIMTTSGIYGTVTNIKDDRFVVKIADNTKIEINKGFVQNKFVGSEKEN